MRAMILAGVLIAAVGAYILVRGLTYKSSDTVLDVGVLKAKVEERKSVPAWIGVAAIAGGLVLVGAGARKR